MKKATKVTLGVIGGIIVVAVIASSGDKSGTQTVQNSNAANTQQSAQQEQSEAMTIKNSVYQNSNGLQEVVGEITNNTGDKHSAMLKATFYAADGSIMGTATGAVNDVTSGETKTFNLLTTDEVAGYTEMKVQIDTLL